MTKAILNVKSLKEQVYDYLRKEFHSHTLTPGSIINMDTTCKELGISKTPLREALLQLEIEGFVTIIPRRGIYVNSMSKQEVKEFYQIIGAIESVAIRNCSDKIKKTDIDKMKKLNKTLCRILETENFDQFLEKNVEFHNVYIELTRNNSLIKILDNLKKRLYDFPQAENWIKEWELKSLHEHEQIVEYLSSGKFDEAADFIQNVHWNFANQEKYINQYYKYQ